MVSFLLLTLLNDELDLPDSCGGLAFVRLDHDARWQEPDGLG